MSESKREIPANFRNDLLEIMSVSEERYKYGLRTIAKEQEIRVKTEALRQKLANLNECANHITKMYKNIKHYANEHQKHVRDILDLAILKAGELVPDASVDGIHLEYDDSNQVTVVNGKGQNINLREGGGYRTLLGALLRYACIKAQPGALPLILFDESFFALNDITVELARDVFMSMKKDISIITIEQRNYVLSDTVDKQFVFEKGLDGITEVREVT